MQPFTHKDFENNGHKNYLTIGDLISGLSNCTHLYPDILKEEAFKEYFTPVSKSSDGYTPKIRKMKLKLVHSIENNRNSSSIVIMFYGRYV